MASTFCHAREVSSLPLSQGRRVPLHVRPLLTTPETSLVDTILSSYHRPRTRADSWVLSSSSVSRFGGSTHSFLRSWTVCACPSSSVSQGGQSDSKAIGRELPSTLAEQYDPAAVPRLISNFGKSEHGTIWFCWGCDLPHLNRQLKKRAETGVLWRKSSSFSSQEHRCVNRARPSLDQVGL